MHIIGLISGTSMDAIDAALVELAREDDTLRLCLRAFAMLPYDPALRERVVALLPPNSGSTVAVCEVHALVGEVFAEAALVLAERAGVPIATADLIASHGQTVYHQVADGAVRSTLQLGAPAVIAERTGRTVVADFRPRDIAAGGQGAPLVPYLDWLLFADTQRHRAIQNIGGIGNVTYFPSTSSAQASQRSMHALAFDTGPGNVLIDEAMRLLSGGAETYDRDGQMAAAGQVDAALLADWLEHPFFRRPPPRTTGREEFGVREAMRYIEQARAQGLSPASIVATLTAFTAHSIADSYQCYCGPIDEVLVSGGGARNSTLLRLLQAALPTAQVRPLDDMGLDADAKEAVAFAVMGYAALHGWPNNLPAATGASHGVVMGNITPGANYRALLEQVITAPAAPISRVRIGT